MGISDCFLRIVLLSSDESKIDVGLIAQANRDMQLARVQWFVGCTRRAISNDGPTSVSSTLHLLL